MKRFYFICLLLLTHAATGHSQVSTQNYIQTRTMLNSSQSSYLDQTVYYDGIGRPFQTLLKGITPARGNLISLQDYDQSGRETNSWLPIPVTNTTLYMAPSTFKNNAPSSYSNDAKPYSQSVYEASPRNRIIKQYGPGAAWHNGHPISTTFLSNTATGTLSCLNYKAPLSGSPTSAGNYAPGELNVICTIDEDGNTSYDFIDKIGRRILTRHLKGSETHDTYSVYDNYGNLRFVLQPMYQSNANLDLYAFQYKYDNLNRCIWQKIPGAQHVEYVYDSADRLVFSQDGNQRTANKWIYYLYDNFNRLTQQGECTNKNTTSGITIHIRNYYDKYNFIGTGGFSPSYYTAGNSNGIGSLTGSDVYVFGTNTRIYTAYYYDIKGRETQRVFNKLPGGFETVSTVYTFTGNPSTVTYTRTDNSRLTEVYNYTYDHADRVSKIEHILNGVKVTLAGNVYDNFGRLLTQSFHGAAANKLTYAYNIRSWLTGITSTNFTQNLYYTDGNNATKCYNGNISSMTWKGSDGIVRGYKLNYDGLNRMTNATYGEAAAISTNLDRFTEKVTGYDKNGNIKALQRYGQTTASAYGLIDNLTYTLTGNQLNRVDDAVTASAYNNGFEFKDAVKQAGEYAYDANGNLTKDLNKGITLIQYNMLNLPSSIAFSDGSTITYTYSADGRKLRTAHKIGTTTTTTDYCGNVIYENGTAKQLLTEEGYVSLSDGKYHYYLKDHQGNNRVVINQGGTVEETSHYYPFGGTFACTNNVQPYKYNGKEYDAKKGLNWYDYGARRYDAAVGRFTTIDPLAEKYYSVSPYVYCLNNPIYLIDKDGCAPGPGDLFKTKREAAKDWGMYYNGASIIYKREMGSSIYEVRESGKLKGYSYSEAAIGEVHSTKISRPSGTETVAATIHSHANYDGLLINNKGEKSKVADNKFSTADKKNNSLQGLTGYLTTPNGSLLEHNPLTNQINTISTELPSDPKDPSRQNKVNPVDKTINDSQVIFSKVVDWLNKLLK